MRRTAGPPKITPHQPVLPRTPVRGVPERSVQVGVKNAQFRCEDGKISQNGGHHAIRRRKLPLENDLPDFFFWKITFFGNLTYFVCNLSYIIINY